DRGDPERTARPAAGLREGRRGVAGGERARSRARPGAGQEQRRADLPAARHRPPPREIPARRRARDRPAGRRPHRSRPPRPRCRPDSIELVMNQFVTLSRGGETVKQSKRRATYVTVDELLAEVGADVFRFFMIERKADGHLDFDVDLAKEKDWKKNPAYYVQYAHARSHGIERRAAEAGIAFPDPAQLRPVAPAPAHEHALIP